LPAFAIDDEGSQDPDDALSLDGPRLWVHVADVAALIPPDSPADLEARARGANLYLPEGTAPMLPPQATQRLALGLAGVSPALSFGLEIDDEGRPTLVEITPSWVRVTRQTYEAVDAQLETEPFAALYRIAQLGQARRRANGAANIELPAVKIRVRDGQVIIRPLPSLKSRDLVQEAMLLCGEAIARYALAQHIPFPFATQDAPEERQFPQTSAEMFAYRRAFQRSQVKSVPGPHAGMGLELYAQATSPLRRYSDLVAHQQLRAFLRGDVPLSESEILERIGAAEAIAGSVRQAERLANKHWTLVYLRQNPGWRGQGILVDTRNRRGYVLIPDLDLEIRLHLREDLPY
jgi:exoribonuclease-2